MKHLTRIFLFAALLAPAFHAHAQAVKPAKSPAKAPEATPVSAIKINKDFKVELLYTVPMAEQGSWVASCFDDKGRLIESDQYGRLYRVTLPALGGNADDTKVEQIPADLGEAQGLLFVNHALYVVTNSDKYARGLYRVTSSKNDDTLDKVELLRAFPNLGGEHGPHAVLLGPDGKSLYVIVGDQTPITEMNTSRVPKHWDEDLLTPRIYGRGFMRDVPAPGGWVAKTDFYGKTWELICTGFRNPYDAAFNRTGDLFTFDADMEWDMSLPWYRPTRVCQVVSGGEFGWRNGSAKWPVRWEDSLPPVVDIGPGSPTGMCFGYGAKFPVKWQNALFMCDWSYGKLYAAHIKPQGASYGANFEEFLSAQPLPLTDVVISPKDGAMYLTIGGRKVQSGLYRVTYMGKESTVDGIMISSGELRPSIPADAYPELLRQLEAFHEKQDPKAIEVAWPNLNHEDRFVRFAARIAIEHQPIASWKNKALEEQNPRIAVMALMALCRAGHEDKTLLPKVIAALDKIDFKALKGIERNTFIRDYALTFCRFGTPMKTPAPPTIVLPSIAPPAKSKTGVSPTKPQAKPKPKAEVNDVPMPPSSDDVDPAIKKQVIAKLSPLFPTKEPWLDVDLAEVLTFVGDAAFLSKAIAIMENAPTQEEQIAYAKNLRLAKNGWTPELHEHYFKWLCLRAPTYNGGANMGLFIADMRRDAEANLTAAEKLALKPILEAVPDIKTPQFTFTPRNFVKDWKIGDLEGLLGAGLEGNRSFDNGRNLFGAASCYACHRFNNEGGAVGPDLSIVAGKYSPRDLLRNILEPSLEISDQYAQMEVTLTDGNKLFGRIVNMHGDTLHLNTNMMAPNEQTNIPKKNIKIMEVSKISMMPPGLLNTLKDSDILDLLAYLLSKGNKEDPMFK